MCAPICHIDIDQRRIAQHAIDRHSAFIQRHQSAFAVDQDAGGYRQRQVQIKQMVVDDLEFLHETRVGDSATKRKVELTQDFAIRHVDRACGGRVHVADAQRHDIQIGGTKLTLAFRHLRQFRQTGLTPGGPKIQQDKFSRSGLKVCCAAPSNVR